MRKNTRLFLDLITFWLNFLDLNLVVTVTVCLIFLSSRNDRSQQVMSREVKNVLWYAFVILVVGLKLIRS